jgi:hypothetical protein
MQAPSYILGVYYFWYMIKYIDQLQTGFMGAFSICLINLVDIADIQSIYTLFVQSLVATATIGKILWDIGLIARG